MCELLVSVIVVRGEMVECMRLRWCEVGGVGGGAFVCWSQKAMRRSNLRKLCVGASDYLFAANVPSQHRQSFQTDPLVATILLLLCFGFCDE